MRFTLIIVAASAGSLAFTQGCSSSAPSSGKSGLWSCFDTGAQVACTHVSGLSTAAIDVNGDGVPDRFVCADDDDDGHDRGRDRDQSGLLAGSGHDEDHDGLDDDVDCDHRHECESLSNDANDARHDGEIEARARGRRRGRQRPPQQRSGRRRAGDARRAHLHRALIATNDEPASRNARSRREQRLMLRNSRALALARERRELISEIAALSRYARERRELIPEIAALSRFARERLIAGRELPAWVLRMYFSWPAFTSAFVR